MKMSDDSGILSIDFLVGFTIFLLAFIWVVSMIPGLLINLQGYTIDYDAVAYRTGVILVEDPGWPVSPPWESFLDPQKNSVTRFGLAISKDTPNILSQDKVNRFFCETAFIYPDDYHTRAVFGDYPYGFNISLIDLGGQNRSRGDALPDGYGYIRRVVKIKGTSNATINNATYTANPSYIKTDNVTTHVFSILIDNPRLLGDVTDPAYQIDPAREQITINITDLKSTITNFAPDIDRNTSNITLRNIKVYKLDGGFYSNVPLPASDFPYIDGSNTRVPAMPANVTDNVTLRFSPQFFDLMKAQNSQIYIALGFDVSPASTFLNNTQALPDYDTLDGKLTFDNPNTNPFHYDYNATNVTQPYLRDAVLEVAVWSGAVTRSGGSLTIPINGSHIIYATAGSGGTISPFGSVSVNDGANQTFTIIPNSGHNITDVVVDGGSNGNISSYNFTYVNQDHTIAASFAKAPVSIFFDDFDAAAAPEGWSILGPIIRTPSSPCDGAACVRIRDDPGSITRTISTAGYSGITISFEMGTRMEKGVMTADAEWSPDGGTTWNLLKRISPGDSEDDPPPHLTPFTFTLPASADYNPAFTLRFSLTGPSASMNDKVYIDNVQIGGIAD